MNIVDRTRIEFPCPSCGERYSLALAQVLLSQAILHDGCQARAQDECPPDSFAPLLDHGTILAFQAAWCRLEEQAAGAGGALLIDSPD